MTSEPDRTEEGIKSVEQKLDALSAPVDKRFDTVDEAFVEQRRYTEFAFDRLQNEMKSGFARMDGRFDRLERKLDQFIESAPTNRARERHQDDGPDKRDQDG